MKNDLGEKRQLIVTPGGCNEEGCALYCMHVCDHRCVDTGCTHGAFKEGDGLVDVIQKLKAIVIHFHSAQNWNNLRTIMGQLGVNKKRPELDGETRVTGIRKMVKSVVTAWTPLKLYFTMYAQYESLDLTKEEWVTAAEMEALIAGIDAFDVKVQTDSCTLGVPSRCFCAATSCARCVEALTPCSTMIRSTRSVPRLA